MIHLWNQIMQMGRMHGVNPWVFGILYVIHHPLFWGTLALVVNRVRLRRPYKLLLALDVFFWFMPYLYIFLFGRGLPWWVYVLVLLGLAVGAPHALRELRQRLHQADTASP